MVQMIFGQDYVSCNDFDDCHNKITVAGINFISTGPICDLYLQGKECFWDPLRGQRLSVIDLIADGRGEDFKVSRCSLCRP
jgi:hypothetical protein